MPKYGEAFPEASSIQSCEERTGAFSHHSNARNVGVANARAKSSVACQLRMMATFKKRGLIKPFSQPASHFSVVSMEAGLFTCIQVTLSFHLLGCWKTFRRGAAKNTKAEPYGIGDFLYIKCIDTNLVQCMLFM